MTEVMATPMEEARKIRAVLFDEVREMTDELVRLVEYGLSRNLVLDEAVRIEAAYCDGAMLLCRWEFDGKEDVTIEVARAGAHSENILLLSPGKVLIEGVGIEAKLLSSPGDSFLLKQAEPYTITYLREGGPASGCMVLVPPDESRIPDDSAGRCSLLQSGRCGRIGNSCLKNSVSAEFSILMG